MIFEFFNRIFLNNLLDTLNNEPDEYLDNKNKYTFTQDFEKLQAVSSKRAELLNLEDFYNFMFSLVNKANEWQNE